METPYIKYTAVLQTRGAPWGVRAASVASALAGGACPGLTWLGLGGNDIGPAGAAALAAMLAAM
eukprot:SAG22_NODE_14602_length_370_cov_0.963100_1_plen_63_part_10